MIKTYSEIEAAEIEFVREHDDMPEDELYEALIQHLVREYGEKAVTEYYL